MQSSQVFNMTDVKKIYVFSGKFPSNQAAREYALPQWLPEPDESATDEEYKEWEENNPSRQLKRNIDSYLDEDFIEIIDNSSMDRHDYLSAYLIDKNDINTVKAKEPEGANNFVLIFEESLDGFELKKEPVSTDELSYCGVFDCNY